MRQRVEETRRDGAEERTRRLDSDAAAVQMLTIHGSKGLQFPVVYLPFVADLWPRTPDYPLFHDEDGHPLPRRRRARAPCTERAPCARSPARTCGCSTSR